MIYYYKAAQLGFTNMRMRYWRLDIKEVLNAKYPTEKANHWEITCMFGEYQRFGIFLQSRFGGKILYRQTRVFFQGSKEFADPKSIGILANELSLRFNIPVEITIEFEKITQQEQEENILNLPSNKALPIVGPD
jgi:hypothetical protein